MSDSGVIKKSMRLKADIKIQRKDLVALYDWLDTFADGWVVWGGARLVELSQEKTRQIVLANILAVDEMIKSGRGGLWSTVQVVLPNKQSAMLCKLAWPHAVVEKPERESTLCSD